MRINSIQNQNSFKGVTVTTSTGNSGMAIGKNVIIPFDNTARLISENSNGRYDDIKDKTEVFVLAAGKGKRCLPLSHCQGSDVTKVYYGIPDVDRNYRPTGEMNYVLDIPMAMASPFLDNDGLKWKNATKAQGSFAEVISFAKDLREKGLPQKNVIIMCGDNFFDSKVSPGASKKEIEDKKYEITDYLADVARDDSKILGLIGVKRTPEETANNYGCLKAIPTSKDDICKLDGFTEKPKTAELARKFAMDDGNCIANTGSFIMKKEAMEWLLDRIEEDPMFIGKDENELYDFAAASTRVQEHFGADKCSIKLVQDWEDAGQPDTMASLTGEIAKGNYLNALPEDLKRSFQRSAANNYYNDGIQTTILATPEAVGEYETAENLAYYIETTGELPEPTDNVLVKDVEGMYVAGVKD